MIDLTKTPEPEKPNVADLQAVEALLSIIGNAGESIADTVRHIRAAKDPARAGEFISRLHITTAKLLLALEMLD